MFMVNKDYHQICRSSK